MYSACRIFFSVFYFVKVSIKDEYLKGGGGKNLPGPGKQREIER
jgi:hypothetical protein